MSKQKMSSSTSLSVKQLSVCYQQNVVLKNITLDIPSGVIAGIIGPNGAGKSTFLKAVLGLVKGCYKEISFFQKPLKQMRKLIAYVPQRDSVDWNFPISVYDLVLMGKYGRIGLFRWPSKQDKESVYHYLDKVGMLKYADRQISQLSGGQQQRVFLARALMQEADIYFLDEPFTGIDHLTETVLMKILRELASKGKTVYIVHHDLNSVENYFDWLIVLNKNLIASGPVEEVFNSDCLQKAYGHTYAIVDKRIKPV